MKKLVLASSNPGKLRELSALLHDWPYEIIPQSDLNVSDVAETGTTFVENAIIKARHAAQQTGYAALADDSGIVVDALNGEPGVYSARFSGSNASDDANNALLRRRQPAMPAEIRQPAERPAGKNSGKI